MTAKVHRTPPRVAVVYFSLEGNVKHLAESVSRATGGTLIELVPLEPARNAELTEFVWGDSRIVCEERPHLDTLQRDPGEYDLIFLGSPVWKGSVAPAVLSFLERCDFYRKQVALFCAYSGRSGGFFEHAEKLLLGCEIVGTIGFRDPIRLSPQKSAREIAAWAKGIGNSLTV